MSIGRRVATAICQMIYNISKRRNVFLFISTRILGQVAGCQSCWAEKEAGGSRQGFLTEEKPVNLPLDFLELSRVCSWGQCC